MGNNENGELGDGSLISRDEFVQITSDEAEFKNIRTVMYKGVITDSAAYFNWSSENPTPKQGGRNILERYNLDNDNYYEYLDLIGKYFQRDNTLATNVMLPSEEVIE